MTLSKDQKSKILELYEERTDIHWIAQQVFGGYDDKGEKKKEGEFSKDGIRIDGRTKEGRAIRAFLSSRNKKYNTTKSEKKTTVSLTDKQKEFLLSDHISAEMNPLEIARETFEDGSIKSLSAEHRLVIDFLSKYRKDVVDENAMLSDGKWHSPKSLLAVIRKTNKWCDITLPETEEKLSTKHKRYMEKLLEFMQVYKLSSTLNSFQKEADRELFESEFVRATWDKPDLTNDEVNLYMMVCANYVRAKHIQARLDTFTRVLEDEDLEINDINMRLTEHVKATNDELNACERRIESMIHKLNGSRAERLKNQRKSSGNILDLVRTFQEQEGRNIMVQMANMRRELVKEEADRIESLDEFKARVFGIEKDELL